MKFSFIFKRCIALILVITLAFQLSACFLSGGESSSTTDPIVPDVVILTPSGNSGNYGNNGTTGNNEDTIIRNGYAISTSNAYATAVGASILENGGNAIDAAIAVSYTLCVVEPYGSGIGGGGGMTIYDPSKDEYKYLDYLAEAPSSGARHLDIGIPGFVSGMQKAYELYGTMDFAELLEPAISYAENGFNVNDDLLYRINNAIRSFSSSDTAFTTVQKAGDLLVQPEMAETLKSIVSEGSDAFYTGNIASKISASTGMTMEDLANYETLVADAVVGEFAGYEIASAGTPFSGITLIQMLKLCEILEIPDPTTDPKGYIEDLIKVSMSCGKDRISKLCDARFDKKERDYQEMVSDEYVCDLLNIDYSDYVPDDEGQDTTHISIIDKDGMTVAVTNTLTQFFGSKLYVDGFFLNNALRNFGKGINEYAPGKRTRTYMSPTILQNDAGEVLTIGTPGGTVILSVMTTILLDICLFDTPAQDAVNKRRVVVKDEYSLLYEPELGDYPIVVDASGTGYYLVPMTLNAYFGSVNIAAYSPENGFSATADIRRFGSGRAVKW